MGELLVSGSTVIRKFILTEGSQIAWPPQSKVIHSEVVMNASNTEVLEVWLAIPSDVAVQVEPYGEEAAVQPTDVPTPKPIFQQHTIETNTASQDLAEYAAEEQAIRKANGEPLDYYEDEEDDDSI